MFTRCCRGGDRRGGWDVDRLHNEVSVPSDRYLNSEKEMSHGSEKSLRHFSTMEAPNDLNQVVDGLRRVDN